MIASMVCSMVPMMHPFVLEQLSAPGICMSNTGLIDLITPSACCMRSMERPSARCVTQPRPSVEQRVVQEAG